MDIEGLIRHAVRNAVNKTGVIDAAFSVEHPSELTHGDYATNAALVVAKQLGRNPRDIAEDLIKTLDGQLDMVERLEVAGPGFINFHLTRDFYTKEIDRALEAGEEWGTNTDWAGKKVIVEYTDPNPFKEFHIGHLFTNSVGESIARLFVASGADTKRVNYQGDVGMHVAHAIYGMQQLGITANSNFSARELGKAYALGATAFKENPEAAAEIKAINKLVYERSDEAVNALYDSGRVTSLEYFETIYKLVGTIFDEYFFESEAAPRGKAVVESHPEVFVESDGARVFKGEEHGLHTRVFLNSEGLPTYEAKELELAKMKEERLGSYDHSIISTSNEITEYFKVLLKALEFIHPDLAKKTEHIGHGTVRLAEGKMSSRTGQVIAAVDFIDEIAESARAKMVENGTTEPTEALTREIAIAAIKYVTLKGNILQDTVFDKEQALSFEGNSGPYLQYTNARINSVLEKAAAAGIIPSLDQVPNSPYEIERILYRLPSVVAKSREGRAPHHLVTYLTELAGSFNSFYAVEKIADPEDEYAPYKAAVAKAVAQTLQNGLWMLGIKAPESM